MNEDGLLPPKNMLDTIEGTTVERAIYNYFLESYGPSVVVKVKYFIRLAPCFYYVVVFSQATEAGVLAFITPLQTSVFMDLKFNILQFQGRIVK